MIWLQFSGSHTSKSSRNIISNFSTNKSALDQGPWSFSPLLVQIRESCFVPLLLTPTYSDVVRFSSSVVQIGRSRSDSPNSDQNWSIAVRFTSFGTKLVDHGPFYKYRDQTGRSRSVLLVQGPNWSIAIHFPSFTSELVGRGPFYHFRVKIGRSRSILQFLGQNLSITAHFKSFGQKSVDHGLFHQFRAQIGRSMSVVPVLGPSWSIPVRFKIFVIYGPKNSHLSPVSYQVVQITLLSVYISD